MTSRTAKLILALPFALAATGCAYMPMVLGILSATSAVIRVGRLGSDETKDDTTRPREKNSDEESLLP